MHMNVGKEIAALQRMTVKQLRERHLELFGDQTRTGNKPWLIKRIAWRLQAQAEGGLSDRALHRAAELANETDLRLSPPRPAPERTVTAILPINGSRLPPPGTVITRDYKGQTLQVRVLAKGFEYEGQVYRSLSAVAKAITGQHMNSFLFFRLANGGAA